MEVREGDGAVRKGLLVPKWWEHGEAQPPLADLGQGLGFKV